MTIVYTNKKFPPAPFDEEVASMIYYRNLYEGNHAEIFARARLLSQDVRYRQRRVGLKRWENTREVVDTNSMYIIANFSSLVAEIPADLLNRALGNISADAEEGPELEFISGVITASKPNEKIWAAVVEHQVDGLIAYRIRRNTAGTVWFEWMLGNKYFPHDDDQGADVTWTEDHGNAHKKDKYLRVERQRLTDTGLSVTQLVFKMDGDTVGEQIDNAAYAAAHTLEIPEDAELTGVTELLCGSVANEETLLTPRGRSALRNVDLLQEEINWTITRDSIVFEKHGKPKLAIPRGLWDSVANQNQKDYGGRFVRNADLEVVSYDEKTQAVPQYIVWDAKTAQSFEHVTRLIKYMMAVSKTSPQAAGLEEGMGESGVALLYLWIQSVIKAEAIKDKFDAAMKSAIRKCIILENVLGGATLEVVNPVIEWGDMLPKAESERDSEEVEKYAGGVQSLETTVRRMHPDWSEDAIVDEIKKIEEEKAVDTLSPLLTQPPRVTL